VRNTLLLLLAAVAPAVASAYCFDEAGSAYGVPPQLLRAIAQVESSMNHRAVNGDHRTRTSSEDLGLMQINSRWLGAPAFRKNRITRDALMTDACLNVKTGAWILANTMHREGANWNGVGAYNAACTQLKGEACTAARSKYAWKVYQALTGAPSVRSAKLRGKAPQRTAPPFATSRPNPEPVRVPTRRIATASLD
jgi:hypothetical protein